jgi:hypothetical protein
MCSSTQACSAHQAAARAICQRKQQGAPNKTTGKQFPSCSVSSTPLQRIIHFALQLSNPGWLVFKLQLQYCFLVHQVPEGLDNKNLICAFISSHLSQVIEFLLLLA